MTADALLAASGAAGLAALTGAALWASRRKRPEAAPKKAPGPAGLEIVRLIALGGMGAVYEAKDPVLRRRVAVKRMRPEIRKDPECKAQFLREARITASLRHPNIVEIFSVVDAPDDLSLVFEYIDGKSAAERLAAERKLPPGECVRIVRQACLALDFAHSQKVLHRDLKPSNIMLGAGGAVKLMDFGIARQAKATITKLTGGAVCGTLSYMAPEQHLGEERRPADLYALAVTFYELLTGALPFKGPQADLLRQKEAMEFKPLGLGPRADTFMARSLAADPNARFPAAAEFLAALEEAFPA